VFIRSKVSELSLLGGDSCSNTVYTIMRKVLHHDIGMLFSLYGRKGKLNFKRDYKFYNVVIRESKYIHYRVFSKAKCIGVFDNNKLFVIHLFSRCFSEQRQSSWPHGKTNWRRPTELLPAPLKLNT